MDVKNVKNVLRKEKHMNKTGKLLSLLLVLAIVFSLSVTALAADTYTITIKGDGSTADHTYEAYQIFSGDLHDPNLAKEENEPTQALILSNIKWGSGVDTTAANFKTVCRCGSEKADDQRRSAGVCSEDCSLPLLHEVYVYRLKRGRLYDFRS